MLTSEIRKSIISESTINNQSARCNSFVDLLVSNITYITRFVVTFSVLTFFGISMGMNLFCLLDKKIF